MNLALFTKFGLSCSFVVAAVVVLDGPPCWLTLHVTSNANLLLKGEKFPTSERLGNLLLKEGRGCFESFICIIQWISAWIRLYSSTQMDLSGANINNRGDFAKTDCSQKRIFRLKIKKIKKYAKPNHGIFLFRGWTGIYHGLVWHISLFS